MAVECCGGVTDFVMGFTHAFNQDVSPIPGTNLVRSDGGRNYSNGAGLGHRAALIVGVLEVGAGIGGDAAAVVGEAVSFGAVTPAAIPLAIGSTGLILHGGSTISKSLDNMKSEGKYSDLKEPRNVGDGKTTTPSQRRRILEENKNQNGGTLKSDGDGRALNAPQQSKRGQRADMNQAEVDHITPRSKGGSNSNSNQRVISKEENLKKGNREN